MTSEYHMETIVLRDGRRVYISVYTDGRIEQMKKGQD